MFLAVNNVLAIQNVIRWLECRHGDDRASWKCHRNKNALFHSNFNLHISQTPPQIIHTSGPVWYRCYGVQKTRMIWLPYGQKVWDRFSYLDRITACDGRTVGHRTTAKTALYAELRAGKNAPKWALRWQYSEIFYGPDPRTLMTGRCIPPYNSAMSSRIGEIQYKKRNLNLLNILRYCNWPQAYRSLKSRPIHVENFTRRLGLPVGVGGLGGGL